MAKNKVPAKKSEGCGVSLEQFMEGATNLKVTIGGKEMVANKKHFATGSFGWFAGEKIVVEIDGTPVKVQVGVNMTVVGSKPTKEE